MTRRVTQTRRSAARDMTKALLHGAADAPRGRHRSAVEQTGPVRRRKTGRTGTTAAPPARVRQATPKM